MSYAALVLAHREPSQVERLAERLECPTWVHYDAKSPADEHRRLARNPKLHTVPRPAKVIWGHWSLVIALLRGLAAVESDPDHVLVLSGDAYPIKPPQAIAERLSEPVSFAHHAALPRTGWFEGGFERVESVWIRRPRLLSGDPTMCLPLRRRRPSIPLYGGSSWFALHRDARERLLDRRATRAARRALRWSELPEEMFVHTVLANSPLRARVVNDGLVYARWRPGGALHPEVLRDADWNDLVKTPALFARKFAPDSPLLDRIDRELLA